MKMDSKITNHKKSSQHEDNELRQSNSTFQNNPSNGLKKIFPSDHQVPSQSSCSNNTDSSLHQYHYIQSHPAAYCRQLSDRQHRVELPRYKCSCTCMTQGGQERIADGNNESRTCCSLKGLPQNDDNHLDVTVTVHRHNQLRQSDQIRQSHSYQTLHKNENHLEESVTCDCDSNPHNSKRRCFPDSSRLMPTDDIISESDDNSILKINKVNNGRLQRNLSDDRLDYKNILSPTSNKESHYSSQIDNIYSDGEGTDSCIKVADDGTSEEDQRPPLPPRPPPCARNTTPSLNFMQFVQYNVPSPYGWTPQNDPYRQMTPVSIANHHANGIKKYVIWCLICGGFSCLLGFLFLGVYFLLHSYTITVGNFETVPTFVPATLLILTGMCVISLARRRNRYSYLIKLSGACGLISALTCALVTVTTTVLHMSRLQALRECEYAQKTRTCTCYSDMVGSQVERIHKEGVRLVFDSLSDCGVVHGSLYSCLRAIFGLSVAGVLVAVFSCMLVYQLLSHERKKMYWEQLELRCRSLYTTQQGTMHANGGHLPQNMPVLNEVPCRCCDQCLTHRQTILPASTYPWEENVERRFWRFQPPGNFYSPNPVGEDANNGGAAIRYNCGHAVNSGMSRSRTSGWSWPRMPWQRNCPDSNSRYRHTPSSPDSQYGFSNNGAEGGAASAVSDHGAAAQGLPYGVWGPPPPYSDPNSPARQRFYQIMQSPNSTQINTERPMDPIIQEHISHSDCNSRRIFDDNSSVDVAMCKQLAVANRTANKRQGCPPCSSKATGISGYDNTPSDSDGCARGRFSNSLPTRKAKKRMDNGAKSIGPKSHAAHRVNVQNVFTDTKNGGVSAGANATPYYECDESDHFTNAKDANKTCSPLQTGEHNKSGVENSGFQKSENATAANHDVAEMCDATESEVYFADVSSCCNISVKNDNYYEGETQRPMCCMECKFPAGGKHQRHDENYLSSGHIEQRRNKPNLERLPFSQMCADTCSDDNQHHLNAPFSNATVHKSIIKENSRQSICSVDSEEKTDFTDLSPATPITHCSSSLSHGINYGNMPSSCVNSDKNSDRNFIPSSSPLSSEFQSLEAIRRSTKNITELLATTAEAQYEAINENLEMEQHFDNNSTINGNFCALQNIPSSKRNNINSFEGKPTTAKLNNNWP